MILQANFIAIIGLFLFPFRVLSEDKPPAEVQRKPIAIAKIDRKTPVDFEKEEGAGSDNLQAKIMGLLCLIYGGFLLLLMAIPNPWTGRLAFAFCGAMMAGIGWLLSRASRAKVVKEAETRLAEAQTSST